MTDDSPQAFAASIAQRAVQIAGPGGIPMVFAIPSMTYYLGEETRSLDTIVYYTADGKEWTWQRPRGLGTRFKVSTTKQLQNEHGVNILSILCLSDPVITRDQTRKWIAAIQNATLDPTLTPGIQEPL